MEDTESRDSRATPPSPAVLSISSSSSVDSPPPPPPPRCASSSSFAWRFPLAPMYAAAPACARSQRGSNQPPPPRAAPPRRRRSAGTTARPPAAASGTASSACHRGRWPKSVSPNISVYKHSIYNPNYKYGILNFDRFRVGPFFIRPESAIIRPESGENQARIRRESGQNQRNQAESGESGPSQARIRPESSESQGV